MDKPTNETQNHEYMDVETKLKHAIKKGDEAKIKMAFQHFYDAYVRLVYRVLIDACGKDSETEDDVQESFLQLIAQMNRLPSVDRITDYWIQTAKYICLNRRKKQERTVEEPAEEQASLSKSIPEILQGEELFERVERLLGYPDALIVILHAAYCYSEKEIALRLNISEDAVNRRYRKGIKTLERRLKDEEE